MTHGSPEHRAYVKGYQKGQQHQKPTKTDANVKDTLLLRQTFEKLTALFAKVHALQVQVQELRAEQRKTLSVFLTLLGDTQTRGEAEAVLRDFYNTK